jgi:anti-sigma-K factor RskA
MIDEAKQELIVQYLLNEVDPSTADEIRAELEGDVELRDFVRQAEDAFASMAYVAPPIQPPAGLAQRILRLESAASRTPATAPWSNIVWLVTPWALAACFAIACVILGMERMRLQKRADQISQEFLALQQKNALVEEELAKLQKKNVLAEIKIATLKAQVAAYEAVTAVVVWDKNQKTGVLQLDKLPPPEPGKDYQLWVIDPKIPQPVSAGVLAVPNNGLIRTSFHPTNPIESAAAFAISVEKAGGAPKPEGQIILVGK